MSQRSEQIAEVIHHELNNFLVKQAEIPRDLFITITKTEVTKDLEHAFISISVLPINKTGSAMEFLKRSLFEAKKYLRKHSLLRRLPLIHLKVDDSALKYRKIERELDNL